MAISVCEFMLLPSSQWLRTLGALSHSEVTVAPTHSQRFIEAQTLPNTDQELWRQGDISSPIAANVYHRCLPSLLPSLLTAEHQSPCWSVPPCQQPWPWQERCFPTSSLPWHADHPWDITVLISTLPISVSLRLRS